MDAFYLNLRGLSVTASEDRLVTIGMLFLAIEDGLGAKLSEVSAERRVALWELRSETITFQLEKLLN
mgnify:CR=1 FL=1